MNEPEKPAIDSLSISSVKEPARYTLATFMGMDSVTDKDNYFMDSEVDSIAIEKLKFEALYLKGFKAVVGEKNYRYLKGNAQAEYESVMSIRTQYSVLVDGEKYSFNGIGKIDCRSIPESAKVSINSKVLSLFSDKKHLGKLIVLESIEKIE